MSHSPRSLLAGAGLAALVAVAAEPLARLVPLAGWPVAALVAGIAVRTLVTPSAGAQAGIRFVARNLLGAAIVALGATLSLSAVVHVGGSSLPVLLGTLAAALAATRLAGAAIAVGGSLRTLIGVGTGICGASAIAAVAGAVEASDAEIAYATAVIFLFNVVAVIVYVPVGHLIGLSQRGFGLWAGTAVNDTSSVVACAYAYGHAAGAQAIVVKLTRATMIIPVTAALAGRRARRSASAGARRPSPLRLVPWFLALFVVAAAADSAGVFSSHARAQLSTAGIVLIAVALAAVGLSTPVRELRRAGRRPLLLGAVLWATVALSSLGLQALTGSL